MKIGLASFKGGVGKSITAVHLGAYFQQKGPTLVVDCNDVGSLRPWAQRGSLPFRVIHKSEYERYAAGFEHVIFEATYSPRLRELVWLADRVDLFVVPCLPEWSAIETLRRAWDVLGELHPHGCVVALTKVPPPPQKDGPQSRELIRSKGFHLLDAEIRQAKVFDIAATVGCTVRELRSHPRSLRAWAEYEAMGKEIEQIICDQTNMSLS
jgi:chromosome partitioning protein